MNGWVLVILIFTLQDGHSLSDRSYRDRIEIGPFQTKADCERSIPQVNFQSFPRLDDLSIDIHQVKCSRLPVRPGPRHKP